MKQILKLCAYFSITILLAFTQTVPVRALDQRFYAGNDILYYDPDAKDPCVTSTADQRLVATVTSQRCGITSPARA